MLDEICNLKIDLVSDTFEQAQKECTRFEGYLPRITSEQDFNLVATWAFGQSNENAVWVSLTTDNS